MAFSRDLRLYWWSPARVIGLGLLPCPIRYFGVLKISKTSSLRLIMSNGRKDQNRARWLLGTGDWLKKIGDGFFVELVVGSLAAQFLQHGELIFQKSALHVLWVLRSQDLQSWSVFCFWPDVSCPRGCIFCPVGLLLFRFISCTYLKEPLF